MSFNNQNFTSILKNWSLLSKLITRSKRLLWVKTLWCSFMLFCLPGPQLKSLPASAVATDQIMLGFSLAPCYSIRVSQVALVVKNSPVNAGDARDTGLIPVSGKSPEGKQSNPRQYSCLENLMDRGDWWAAVQRVTKSWTQLKWLSMHSINRGYSDLKYLCVCVHARTHSVTQSCPILSNLMGRSPLGSSVHGILQERIVERVAIPFSRVSSRPRDLHCRKILNHLSHQGSPLKYLYYSYL